MQALVPSDYYDLLEDDIEEEPIDEDVVVENSRYSLQDTMKMNEDVGDALSTIGDVGIDLIGDFTASTISGLDPTRTVGTGTSLLFIAKNLYEIKKGRQRADEIVRQFLSRPNDQAAEKMSDIFDALMTDIIDLFQRIIELIPEPTPAAEATSVLISIVNGYKKVVTFLKTYFTFSKVDSIAAAGRKFTAKSVRRVSFYGVVAPVVKMAMKLFNSDFVPEKVEENKSLIMGTISRIMLLGDLMEDYHIQKEVAIGVGIPEEDFVYRYRILQPGDSADSYDYESPRNELSFEERVEEEIESRREELEDSREEIGADSPEEYSDSLEGPDDSPSASVDSGSSDFIRKLFFTDPGDTSLFEESLRDKSLQYLIEEKEDSKEEESEEEDITEFSGAGGAVAIGTLPLGMSTKGPKGERSATSGGKAFPYSKKNRDAFKQYARKTFGGK
tara:strand:- start:29 stop:1360 length:1332 start_codon:yes stop_codon:yes gene_type:complete